MNSSSLRMLAERAGVELGTPRAGASTRLQERLREMHAAATAYFQDILRRHPEAEPARAYLARRGLSQEIIETFQLGYVLPHWEGLRTYLQHLGFTLEEMVQGGLAIRRENGRTYDRFRERVIFPIHSNAAARIRWA